MWCVKFQMLVSHYLQHLWYLSCTQMWSGLLNTSVLCISVFLHSAEIRVKFNYLNYFVGAFFYWLRCRCETQSTSHYLMCLSWLVFSTPQHVRLK